MNRIKVSLTCLSLCAMGCADFNQELETHSIELAKEKNIEMKWDQSLYTELNQLSLFLFNPGESQPIISRFFEEKELQEGKVDFNLPPNRISDSYEIFAIANLNSRHIIDRYDLYRLEEKCLDRYNSNSYAEAIAQKQPEGGFLFTYNEQVMFSDKQLRLILNRTVAKLEVLIEIDPSVEGILESPLQVDSLCVNGVTTRMFLFDKPSAGESTRNGTLRQYVDQHHQGLFYLYPSAPGDPLPIVNLWCSYETNLSGTNISQSVCYSLPLNGSLSEAGERTILANKYYRLLIRVKGIGVDDLSLSMKIDDWTVQNQNQDF